VAEATGCEGATAHLSALEIEFLFIDTRALDLDARGLSNLTNMKRFNTKLILFESRTKDKINLPGVIHLTKETSSSELICIIKRTRPIPLTTVR
jgi:hypothetical protein